MLYRGGRVPGGHAEALCMPQVRLQSTLHAVHAGRAIRGQLLRQLQAAGLCSGLQPAALATHPSVEEGLHLLLP